MQGFKNLLSRSLLADQSVQPLVKKTDDHRKIVQTSLQHFTMITKNIQYSYTSFQTQIFELHHQLTEAQGKLPQYFIQLTQLFKNINVQLRIFSQKVNGSLKQLNNICNTLFLDYSNAVLNLQQHIRNYQSTQQILFELGKKYARNYKNMQNYLQSYKSSFTDARLIYNNQQKIKRYNLCQSVFKIIIQDVKVIDQKCKKLTQKKHKIKQNLKNIDSQMKRTIKIIGSKIITQTKNYVKNLIQYQKTTITFLAEKKFSLEKLKITPFFQSISNIKYSEYFQCTVTQAQCQIYPALFVYINNLNDDYLPFCKSAFLNYYKEANEKVQKRIQINKKIIQFLKTYIKIIQKSNYLNLKQITLNFQKVKKKISDLFGSKFVSFLKSTNAIFQLSIGIHEKMLKNLYNKLKNIENYLNEENKHMDFFIKQLKSNLQKFIGKKQIKKQDSFNKDKQQIRANLNISTLTNVEQSSSIFDKQQFKQQIKQKSQFLIHLITGFVTKLQVSQKLAKIGINSIIQDFSMSTNQYYSLCCQYEALYFGCQQFINNYKKYENDIDKSLQRQSNFIFNQLNFQSILQDQKPVIFDGQINKVEQFKKLKKPSHLDTKKIIDIENKLQRKKSQGLQLLNEIDSKNQNNTPPDKLSTFNNILQQNKNMKESMISNKSGDKDKDRNKYRDFIYKKITFGEDQQFIKSFSCAFYDKIILQGRIYITNQRICFHSKFNSNNVFFGGTFIQIPKQDIIKIQKRYNALIFDNSLALTTVNGQMFFTSFFSRDQAYDLITKSLDLNPEQQFFQPQQNTNDDDNQLNKSIQLITQEDDLKEENQNIRTQQINKILQNFPYQILIQTQIQIPNITTIKFFRLFDSGQQIIHNRRTYSSFLNFTKDALGHKQIQIHHFKPNILEFLNTSNIKETTPIKIQRKLNAMVPISAAGVPFMPKSARSDEVQILYFISNKKYIIQSTIQNSGAPYTDCFNIKLRRTIQNYEQNKIKMKVQMYVNFMKSTMMKTMIQSKGFQETKAYFLRMMEQVKKYFKNLQKTRKPIQNSINLHKSSSISIVEYQILYKQNQQLIKQKQQKEELIKTLTIKQNNYLKYLIGSIILNIFLILILISS